MTVRESLPNTGETADTRRIYQASMLTPSAVANAARGGVIPEGGNTPGLRVHQTPTASANILIEPGVAQIPLSAVSGLNGSTAFINDARATQRYLQDFPADAQPRVDLIVARAQDAAGGDGSTLNTVAIVKGTAGSAASPAIPNGWNAVPLYTCQLPANATTIVDAYLTRVAPSVVAVGGILPVTSSLDYPDASYFGEYVDHPAHGLMRWDGGGYADPDPRGEIGYTDNDTGVDVGSADRVLLTYQVPVIGGRRYKATAHLQGSQITAAGTNARAWLTGPWPDKFLFYDQAPQIGWTSVGCAVGRWSVGTSGTLTFTLAAADAGGGALRVAPRAASLLVEDLGQGV